jgi:hypothetical protein
MTRTDVTGMSASLLLRLGLIVSFLGGAGCSESQPTDKLDRPEVKEVVQKQVESYKTKTQALKGNSSTGKRRP